jgi:Phage integrase SAM-like domain
LENYTSIIGMTQGLRRIDHAECTAALPVAAKHLKSFQFIPHSCPVSTDFSLRTAQFSNPSINAIYARHPGMKTGQFETVSKPWSVPMTIYKQPGSPYYYYDFYFEKRRYQASTHLRNKTVAHRVECIKKAELAQRRAGILPKKQIPSFRDFAERFLHTIKVERRSNTHRNYLSCVRNLEPVFGRKYLDEITPEMIRAFKEARLELHRSPATIKRDLSCLRQILGIAVKEELIQKSPFFGGRVEFLHEKGRERTLSFDEERKYLKAAAPLLRDVGTIMVEMGLRPGEIFQLRGQDVHIGPPASYVHVREGKSDRAVRDVSVPRERFLFSGDDSQTPKASISFRAGSAMVTTGAGPWRSSSRRIFGRCGRAESSLRFASMIFGIPMARARSKRASMCSVWRS